MVDEFNPQKSPGPDNGGSRRVSPEHGRSDNDLWREYGLGENGRLCITTEMKKQLIKNKGVFGHLGRMVAADVEEIARNPRSNRSVDPFVGTDMGQQRWVNEMAEEIAQVIGFPVVVKRSLGLESEDLRGQFEKMVTLESKIGEALTPEQKKVFGVAKVLAVVTLGEGRNQHEYLFMEKVEGEQMGIKERVPDDLRDVFGVEIQYGITREMGWDNLRYALKQKGLVFDDFKPRNVMVQQNEQGERKYVVLDQGGKYENDGWFVM